MHAVGSTGNMEGKHEGINTVTGVTCHRRTRRGRVVERPTPNACFFLTQRKTSMTSREKQHQLPAALPAAALHEHPTFPKYIRKHQGEDRTRRACSTFLACWRGLLHLLVQCSPENPGHLKTMPMAMPMAALGTLMLVLLHVSRFTVRYRCHYR